MARSSSRFVRAFSCCLGLGVLGVAGTNAVVDPGEMLPGWSASGLHPYRARAGAAAAKALALGREPWDTLALGSSRMEVGFDPTDPAWGDRAAFNLGLPAATAADVAAAFEYALALRRPRTVVLGLDLVMFRGGGTALSPEVERSLFNPALGPVDHWAEQLLSHQRLTESRKTLKAALGWDDDRNLAGPRGFRPMAPGPDPLASMWPGMLRGFLARPGLYDDVRLDPAALGRLRGVIRTCREREIELIVLFLPVHAAMLEVMDLTGHWGTFEELKRAVVALTREEGGQAAVWDFSGHLGPALEPVPGPGQPPMRNYADPSHFTPEVGGQVLRRVLGAAGGAELGVRLEPAGLEAHLAALRAARARFRAEQPDLARWVTDLQRSLAATPPPR